MFQNRTRDIYDQSYKCSFLFYFLTKKNNREDFGFYLFKKIKILNMSYMYTSLKHQQQQHYYQQKKTNIHIIVCSFLSSFLYYYM